MTAPVLSRWLTPPAIAQQLGVKVETVHGWIRHGELRAISVSAPGKRPRFRIDPADLEAWIARRTVAPTIPKTAVRKRQLQAAARDYFV